MTPFKRVGLAAAAGLAMVVGARIRSRPEGAEYRGADKVTAIAPTGGNAVAQPRFVWRTYPTATSYELEIFSVSGDSVYSIMTADTTLVLPRNAHLVPGDYVWFVRAIVVGETRASSPGTRFRFQP